MYIYKQFREYKPLSEMEGIQWFSQIENYGETYGPILKKYKFIKNPRLLDIGNANIRQQIVDTIKKRDPKSEIEYYSDPNNQYSGGRDNYKYHNLVQQYFSDYDGTIIDSNKLEGNDKYTVEDLDGPTEIVLWKDFTTLLEEVNDITQTSGSKLRRRKNKTKKKSYNYKKNKKSRKNKSRKKFRKYK